MKNICFILTLLFAGFFSLSAQEEDPVKREKMFREVQEFKMKYLAQEMDLSELQKKKFFEVYEEMMQSKRECFHDAVVMDRKLKEEKHASEADYQNVRSAFNQANANWAEIENRYDAQFSEFLSQKQIYQMKEAENNFRARYEEMKHNRRKEHHRKRDEKK